MPLAGEPEAVDSDDRRRDTLGTLRRVTMVLWWVPEPGNSAPPANSEPLPVGVPATLLPPL